MEYVTCMVGSINSHRFLYEFFREHITLETGHRETQCEDLKGVE
jgi:hypothetical protein